MAVHLLDPSGPCRVSKEWSLCSSSWWSTIGFSLKNLSIFSFIAQLTPLDSKHWYDMIWWPICKTGREREKWCGGWWNIWIEYDGDPSLRTGFWWVFQLPTALFPAGLWSLMVSQQPVVLVHGPISWHSGPLVFWWVWICSCQRSSRLLPPNMKSLKKRISDCRILVRPLPWAMHSMWMWNNPYRYR